MSYHTWHDYGIGICMDEIKIDTVERIHKLIQKAPNLFYGDCRMALRL